jgi:hypothetical protein
LTDDFADDIGDDFADDFDDDICDDLADDLADDFLGDTGFLIIYPLNDFDIGHELADDIILLDDDDIGIGSDNCIGDSDNSIGIGSDNCIGDSIFFISAILALATFALAFGLAILYSTLSLFSEYLMAAALLFAALTGLTGCPRPRMEILTASSIVLMPLKYAFNGKRNAFNFDIST